MNLSFFNSCRFEVKVNTTCVDIDFPSLQSAYDFCNWIMLYDDKVNLCSIELVYVDKDKDKDKDIDNRYKHHIIESWFYSRKDHDDIYNRVSEEIKKDMENYFKEDSK